MSIVVNLFAGPGAGKSTACAQIYSELKWLGVNCEMALEYAKDKVWEESVKLLENQDYIFGKQLHRINRLINKVDVIITDSPLLLSIIYDATKSENFKKHVIEIHNRFENFNFFIEREKPYNESGRTQKENEAKIIDNRIKNLLKELNISYSTVVGNKREIERLSTIIYLHLEQKNIL
jgi:adenylate kinase family enzyme